METQKIELLDVVEMKKPHPCVHKSKLFQVVRLGADIKIQCLGCGNVIMMPREDFNKRLKKFLEHKDIQIMKK